MWLLVPVVHQEYDYHSKIQEYRAILKNQLESRIEGERIGHEEDLCLCTPANPKS